MSKVNSDKFKVTNDKKVKIKDFPTKISSLYSSKSGYEECLSANVARIGDFQDRLYAENTTALLVIFQAMDAAGKDSAIKHVFSGVNPQGCEVHSFKQPNAEELEHDFLWRSNCRLPERGKIGIFNRSYYEEVLVARVHPTILESQGLPHEVFSDKDIWRNRFESINNFEKHLSNNGTRILKFYLNLSKGEQRRRFLARIDTPEKNWKFGMTDVSEREFWDDYMKCYEECLRYTSSQSAPWYVIPADEKHDASLIISQIVAETLSELSPQIPKLSKEKVKELQAARSKLQK